MIARRGLLAGLGLALAAPAIVRTPGLLMPVRVRSWDLAPVMMPTPAIADELVTIHDMALRGFRYGGFADRYRPHMLRVEAGDLVWGWVGEAEASVALMRYEGGDRRLLSSYTQLGLTPRARYSPSKRI